MVSSGSRQGHVTDVTGFCKGGYENPGVLKDTEFLTSLGIN